MGVFAAPLPIEGTGEHGGVTLGGHAAVIVGSRVAVDAVR
jgi:hypothetical protein